MTVKRWLRTALAAGVLSVAGVAAAPQSVSSSDIQRLQAQLYQAGSELGRLRSTGSALASRLEDELDELRDEVVYLKVKLRKDGTVNRTEYAELRDKVQTFRSRTRGDGGSSGNAPWGRQDDRGVAGGVSGGTSSGVGGGTGSGSGSGKSDDRRPPSSDDRRPSSSSGRSAIPVGQEIDVRLQNQLSSDNAQVEDRFETTTAVDLYQ